MKNLFSNCKKKLSLFLVFIFVLSIVGINNEYVIFAEPNNSPIVEQDGTVTLLYKSDGSVDAVQLAGSILDVDWKDRKDMTKAGDVFTIKIKKEPGEYQYKYIVNGEFILDPTNDKVSSNDNSVVYVPGLVDIDCPNQIKIGEEIELKGLVLDIDGNKNIINAGEFTWEIVSGGGEIVNGVYKAPSDYKEEASSITIKATSNNGISIEKNIKVVEEVDEVQGGRLVILAGNLQTLISGTNAWDPGAKSTRMLYKGNNLYEFTIKDMPSGVYEYKIAMGSWNENYGKNGEPDGPNMQVVVKEQSDVTFFYSDVSHMATDSTKYNEDYVGKAFQLEYAGEKYDLIDEMLNGIFSTSLNLEKGSYGDLKILAGDEKITVPEFTLDEAKKVTIGFDMVTGLTFNDASSKAINSKEIEFNSRQLEYKEPFGAVEEDTEVKFSIKTKKDDLEEVKFVLQKDGENNIISMSKESKEESDIWTTGIKFNEVGTYNYYFVLSNGSQVVAYSDDDGYFGEGIVSTLGELKPYAINVFYKDFKTPDWMKNGVVYQIYPDRFLNGDWSNDEAQLLSRGEDNYEFYDDWYAIPEDPQIEDNSSYIGTKGDKVWNNEIYGGDIQGIIARLDYIQALGVNIIYLNPINKSISNHRYDASDYSVVDPILGSMEDYEELLKEADKRGMKIILDGVFNHVSDDSIYFDRYGKFVEEGKPLGAYQYWSKVYDLMKEKNIDKDKAIKEAVKYYNDLGITDFHYKDWFEISNEKNEDGVYLYEGWWGYDSMPVIKSLNGSEYAIESWRDEVIDGENAISRQWLQMGTNGWRLDVANEISDETWINFRKAVKEEGDNVIIGEIWSDASKYLLGDMYDTVMNYKFRDGLLGYVSGKDASDNPFGASDAVELLEWIREQYPEEAYYSMMNLVSSHDTQRAISAFDGYKKSQKDVAKESSENAIERAKLIPIIQLTYPGTPSIYYGEEIGMVGADDPDNRRGMNWGKGNEEISEIYALLANVRQNYEVFTKGDIDNVMGVGNIISYTRNTDTEHAMVITNIGGKREGFKIFTNDTIEDGTELTDVLTNKKYTVDKGMVVVDIEEKSGLVLLTNYEEIQLNKELLSAGYDEEYIEPTKEEGKQRPRLIASSSSKNFNGIIIVALIIILVLGGFFIRKKVAKEKK